MKKRIKAIALLCAIAVLAVTLCSCRALDSAREHQAFYKDSTHNEIILGDQTYRKIDSGNKEFIFVENHIKYYESFYVTEKDVPVLLASYNGETLKTNEDKSIVYTYDIYTYDTDKETWYVREDLYDEYVYAIESAVLDHYYYSYYDYPEDDYWNGGKETNVILNDEITEIINRTLSIPDDKKVNYSDDEYYSSTKVYLYSCDKDMRIKNSVKIELIYDGFDYYVWNGNTFDEKSLCPVDEKDISVIKSFFKTVLSFT